MRFSSTITPIDPPGSQLRRVLRRPTFNKWGTVIRGFDVCDTDTKTSILALQQKPGTEHSFITNLSDDILGHIFSLLVVVYGPDGDFTVQSQISDCISRDALRYASQVCVYWRNLTLGNPALWSNVDIGQFGTQAWSEEMIKRSYPMPLNVRCFSEPTFHRLFHDPNIISRLYMIAVWAGDLNGKIWETLICWSALATSNLEILAFNWSNNGFDIQPLPLPDFPVTDRPFSIKELHFRGCRSDVNSPLFRNMRILRVDLTRDDSAITGSDEAILISQYDLLVILAQMPLLTELYLQEVFTDEPLASLPQVDLPNLQFLSVFQITKSPDRFSSFISCLTLPSTCVFDISWDKSNSKTRVESGLSIS